eukprot:577858-Amorphochlora_amoeboformis.AAC.1
MSLVFKKSPHVFVPVHRVNALLDTRSQSHERGNHRHNLGPLRACSTADSSAKSFHRKVLAWTKTSAATGAPIGWATKTVNIAANSVEPEFANKNSPTRGADEAFRRIAHSSTLACFHPSTSAPGHGLCGIRPNPGGPSSSSPHERQSEAPTWTLPPQMEGRNPAR